MYKVRRPQQQLWPRIRLPLGWVLNWVLLFGLLFTWLLYVCEFSAMPHPDFIQRELMWTWSFSVVQRFVVNEPLIIVMSKLGPQILKSSLFYACFSERCIEASTALLSALISAARSLGTT